ncbi:nitrite reductase large subunit NirB [Paenibacillus soyae]|uniref:Nitrite reductase large subunit NirB n=1 Tax=Paenibacillus soyae TaxID=2969249 RepID=A0A9X2S8I8_9BACL|nr:nitrite reductase large subunit NirB [Paenibacillus soyae]MCR2804096.1 nitrite reductase large subunit NirB [Paenibacillus soyae]
MNKLKLVVVGNGMAGVRCVEEILKLDPERFQITIFGSEPRPNYNRILLSKVLQGNSAMDEIIINDWSWYDENRIRLYTGETVVKIDSGKKIVETKSGIKAEYDMLILATGSSPFIPPIDGVRKPGVIAFRNMDDCRIMMEHAEKYRKAAVIGGGLLGLEAARGLLNLGMETDVIHNAPYLMNRQLDYMSAELLRKELEAQGMRFWLNANTESITGRSRAKGIRFATGVSIEADLVIVAVGIIPNVELAKSSGIRTNRAIVVDDYMRTSVADIYAVGECAEHRGIAYGLVAPLYEQGKVLAQLLCRPNEECPPYVGSVPSAQLKVSGVEMFSVGEIQEQAAGTALQMYDGIKGAYKKVTMADGKICGAILYGDTSEANALLQLVKQNAPVSALASSSAQQGAGNQDEQIAAMPDKETVCACNAVSKGTIMRCVVEDGLETAQQVKEKTKASGSCGGCKSMVEAIVSYAKRKGSLDSAAAAPICACTDCSHEQAKQAIMHGAYGSVEQVVSALGWKRKSGCDVCVPALRYYFALRTGDASKAQEGEPIGKAYVGMAVTVADESDPSSLPNYDARSLGDELGRLGRKLAFPTRLKAVVASGLHQAAGVLVHDIGITDSPAGWQIYVAGHAENPVRQGQLLGIAESYGEALELSAACLQLYREKAEFMEPLWKWVEREGLVELRETLFDTDYRLALHASFRGWEQEALA